MVVTLHLYVNIPANSEVSNMVSDLGKYIEFLQIKKLKF